MVVDVVFVLAEGQSRRMSELLSEVSLYWYRDSLIIGQNLYGLSVNKLQMQK